VTVHSEVLPARTLPRFGGFSTTFLGLELRRLLRNRRIFLFTIALPPVFFLLFGGSNAAYRTESAGHGNLTAYLVVSLAIYGAMLANTSGGASVSLERAAGWSRQLRLTPLRPAAYIAVKLLVALVLGLVSVLVTFAVGAASGAHMTWYAWLGTGLLAWVCALVFAAFGLFMGYLLPSENVMQLLGPALALLAFAGGLFVPLDQMGHTFATIARLTPAYGVGEIARYPLTGDGSLGWALLNVAVWTVVFATGAAWRFRRDTART
jgi:ABC-2 type transport system permease protein